VTPASFEGLEQAYDQIAVAIDRAGPANEALFLAKLVLALAHQLDDVRIVADCIERAAQGLVIPTGQPEKK
jgi:hypothetical protein